MLDFDNKNKIYLCHFPGDTTILQEQVEKELINKKFSVDKQISLVCAFNININDGTIVITTNILIIAPLDIKVHNIHLLIFYTMMIYLIKNGICLIKYIVF